MRNIKESMFGNKLMTAQSTLKTLADQQSAWGSSLMGVFVVVQCMKQYTENSPGCITAKYTNTGGRRKYITQCWKHLLARWTETDHIADTHGVFPKKSELIHFLQAMRSSSTFSMYQFLLQGELFLWSIFETSFCWSPQVWTQMFAHGYFRRTCFVHTRRPRTTWWTSHKSKRVFSCIQMLGLRESRHKTSHAYFHLPPSCVQASTKCS